MELPARDSRPRLTALPSDPDDGVETVVRRHLLGVWRYLRVLGARPDEADDLTQETFVVALDKNAQDRDPAAFSAFLRRTARFLWLRRHRGRHEALLTDAVDLLWERDPEDGELVDHVRACVGELRERARTAIRMHYGEGASRAAIAGALDMQENGVKTLLQRARQAVRTCLERRRS